MRFRHYDKLRLFDVVARHLSFTSAADELNLSKGAVSYQINQLEEELGFAVFLREHRGIRLTERGKKLWHGSQTAFMELERLIEQLREMDSERITVGMSSYFASRWLSQRLMNFMAEHPNISLRIQPMIDPADFQRENIDLAIRWGKGNWPGMESEPLFNCPAKPLASASVANAIAQQGLSRALSTIALLHDRDDSEAWADWYRLAGQRYRPQPDYLVIPDPNVRLQAVIDNQGIGLYDSLAELECASGQLVQISSIELHDYGYHLVYPRGALSKLSLRFFRDWLLSEASHYSG